MQRRFLPVVIGLVVIGGGLHFPQKEQPAQPVAIWLASPLEVRVVFDRPLKAEETQRFAGVPITFAPATTTTTTQADRSTDRGTLRVAAARALDDGKTLVLATDPHPCEAVYRLDLSSLGDAVATPALDYTLTGVEVEWEPDEAVAGDGAAATGWWPGLDLDGVAWLARHSSEHARDLAQLTRPGRLTLRTQLSPRPEERSRTLRATGPIAIEEVTLGGDLAPVDAAARTATLVIPPGDQPVELVVVIKTGQASEAHAALRLTYKSGPEATPGEWLALPWTPARTQASGDASKPAGPDLAGGDPTRGEAVFFGAEGKCSDCHAFRGRGKQVGPDLSDAGRHDAGWLSRAIAEPSAEIHPDYMPFTVALADGRVLAGTVRSQGPSALRIVDTGAHETVVARTDVTEIRPTATSIMPVGLAGVLGPEKLRDLIAYLRSSAEPDVGK